LTPRPPLPRLAAGVFLLGLRLAALSALCACVAAAGTPRAVAAPTPWTGSGTGTATVLSDGTLAPPKFSYDYVNPCNCGASGNWTFSTTAAASGFVTLPWTYTGLHAFFEVRVHLEAFVVHGATTTVTTLADGGPAICCTPPSAGFTYSGTTILAVQAGDTYGFRMSGSNFDSNSILRGTLTVGGPVNDSWPAATQIDVASGDGTASDSIDGSGQARWYRFAIAPGEGVNVDLTNLPANYDVALFSDIEQAFDSLNNTSDLQHLSAEFAPSAFQPSAFQPSAFQPSAFQPSAFQPSAFQPSAFQPSAFQPSAFQPSAFQPSAFQPSAFQPSAFQDESGTFESAQTRSLVAVSAADGTADEHIVANTWNNTENFYVRVTGRNGADAPSQPFNLHVHVSGGSCGGVAPSTAPLLSGSVPAGVKTLILADYARMPQTQPALQTMKDKLAAFASRAEIAGSIVDVETQSPRVAALVAQADADVNRSCPYAENLVAGAIRDIVQAYRDAYPGVLQSVVLVGNDHAIPFFRYPDAAGLGSESNYVPPVADGTVSQASLRLNYVLSQDAYGAQTTLHLNGLDLPVPDLPVGRLVETPADISGLLDAYTSTSGVVPTPRSSLVTGYDFIASSADSVESDLAAGLGSGATNDELITNQGVAPSDVGTPPGHSWTADQLRTALFGSRHDLIYLGGHFSADNTLAADYSTTVDSTELAASTVDLRNSIVFSPGCHSGYNIVDSDSLAGVTQPLDWVQAFAAKGASVIAGTGYQYGDTDFLAYSLRLYADFAHQLRVGSGPVGLGKALLAAKQQYLASTPQLSGIDVKSLLEATLYGLPMLSVNLPAGRTAPPSAPAPLTPQAFTTNPGSSLGLGYLDREYTPAVTPQAVALRSGANTVTATYLQGPDGVVTAPGEPALPLLADDVGVAGQVLRGVGFLGGAFTDSPGVTPLVGAPTTDLNAVHGPFASSTFFPQRPWSVNYFGGLAGGSTATKLLVTPAQYRSDAPGSLTDLERRYSKLDLRLFYSGNTSPSALVAPPVISRVDASSDGHVQVQAVGSPAAGIQQVWVTYAAGGAWQSAFLAQDNQDSRSWTGDIPTSGSPVQFMVQAVNGVGLVSLDDNVGAFYTTGEIPPALVTSAPRTQTTLQLVSPPSSGAFGSAATVTASLTGVPASVQEPITFTVGSSSRTVTTSGGSATATVPLVDTPGPYTLTASFGGDTTYAPSSASTAFTVSKLPSTLTIALTPAGVAATLTSASTPVLQHTVAFVLTPSGGGSAVTQTRFTDATGKAALGAVPQLASGVYSVQAFFGGGSPIQLPADPVYDAATSGSVQLTVDATPPTITFNGNHGTYGLLDQVSITCTAADAAPTSGLKTNPCTTFSINAPAWSFQPGANTRPVPGLVATDNAGNSSAPAQTTFTVTVTATTLCQLTKQFVQGSPQYAKLSAKQKQTVDALAAGLCTTLGQIVPRLTATQKAALVSAYRKGVDGLVTTGWLTTDQAATLKKFAAAL